MSTSQRVECLNCGACWEGPWICPEEAAEYLIADHYKTGCPGLLDDERSIPGKHFRRDHQGIPQVAP